jgi:antitoxin VapB
MTTTSELAEKQRRVNEFLDAKGLDGLLLGRSENFAWFTCGGDCFVNIAAETGVGALLIRRDGATLITNNVERPRLADEELRGLGLREEIRDWWQDDLAPIVADLTRGQRIAADIALPGVAFLAGDIAHLRRSLTPEEVARYRALGKALGEALGEAAMSVQPGMTEHDVAAAISDEHFRRGIQPIVVLVAADERLLKYRHPLPTGNPVKRAVMLVACGRRHGLIVSATRIVHFGPVPAELQKKHQAVMAVDAALISATRVGTRIGDIFHAGLAAYAAQGFSREWQLHHQGGPTGYAARDYRATAESEDTVQPFQPFAWNPSIAGTKSEDTIIATPDGPEIISLSPGIPTEEIRCGDLAVHRSHIIVR